MLTTKQLSGVKGAKACATYTAGTIWPYKFILHLLSAALYTGSVNLQTNTPVTKVTALPSGDFTVETPRGSLHTKKVVYATNGYTSGLLPEYSANIVPCRGICCQISVPEGSTAPLLTDSYVLRPSDGIGMDYLIPRPDGTIIVGGACQKKQVQSEWYNNLDDSTLIESAKDYYANYMQNTFHGWENSNAKVKKIWTGSKVTNLPI
jgi:glycine/D-amino acid oxidase-like deaminating enzyme